jgi:phospholipase C
LLSAEEIVAINADPHASPHMPQQEKGIKPSSALPYQLYADGVCFNGKSFEIRFNASKHAFGDKALGSPFNVYAPGKYTSFKDPQQMEAARTWAYTVTAGDTVIDNWPLHDFENGIYHLRTYGPNGFYREYKGDGADPLDFVQCHYQDTSGKLTGNVILKVHNASPDSGCKIEIIDHSYGVNNRKINFNKRNEEIILDLSKSHGWYDFSVKVTDNPNFERRFAGRVETGAHSYTDPVMGKMV